MTDKELMVLAARNAGYDIWWKTGICKGGPYESAFIGDTPWRPLEDDGDAFRLLLIVADIQPFEIIGATTRRDIVKFAASLEILGETHKRP